MEHLTSQEVLILKMPATEVRTSRRTCRAYICSISVSPIFSTDGTSTTGSQHWIFLRVLILKENREREDRKKEGREREKTNNTGKESRKRKKRERKQREAEDWLSWKLTNKCKSEEFGACISVGPDQVVQACVQYCLSPKYK